MEATSLFVLSSVFILPLVSKLWHHQHFCSFLPNPERVLFVVPQNFQWKRSERRRNLCLLFPSQIISRLNKPLFPLFQALSPFIIQTVGQRDEMGCLMRCFHQQPQTFFSALEKAIFHLVLLQSLSPSYFSLLH